MSGELSKYILTTVAYYDVMDYPMTVFEIWKYLTKISSETTEKYSLAEVVKELEEEKLKKIIETYRGYYFLKGRPPATLRSPDTLTQVMRAGVAMRARSNLVKQRIERNKVAEKKFRIVRQVVWWLRFVPFVRGVAVTGRMAMKNAQHKSDLDLLVILKKNRIFIGRLLVTFMVHILGKRRYGQKIRDRICLNHFVTTKGYVSGRDIFASHEYAFLLPIFGAKAFMKFQKNNLWMRGFKINFEPSAENLKKIADSHVSKFIRKNLEKILQADFIEQKMQQWQQKRIANNPKSKQSGGIIICNEEELAFWPNFENQGPKVFDGFQERLAELR